MRMPRKCSVARCRSGYDDSSVRIYMFPKDLENRDRWIQSLPNVLHKVTENMGICAHHWPSNAEMVKRKGHDVPKFPPTIFPNCPPSLQRQIQPRPSRRLDERGVSSTARNMVDMKAEQRADIIDIPFEQLENDILKHINDSTLVVMSNNGTLTLLSISSNQVSFVIEIISTFAVMAEKSHVKVNVCDLLDFNHKLSKWSQLRAILNRCHHIIPSITDELEYHTEEIRSLMIKHGVENSAADFSLEQIQLSVVHGKGRRDGILILQLCRPLNVFLQIGQVTVS